MSKYRSPFNVVARCTGGWPYYNSSPAPSSNSHNQHTGEDWVPTVKTTKNWELYTIDNCVVIDAKAQKDVPGFWGGNYITYKCDNGLYVFYAHMAEPAPFKTGDRLTKGTFIAHAGGSGGTGLYDFSTHLHIEVSEVGASQHPSKFGGNTVTGLFRGASSRARPSDFIDFYSGQTTYTTVSGGNAIADFSQTILGAG